MKKINFHGASILKTSDGSSTLVHEVLGELYHSRHGAWTESQHIYIRHGLFRVLETPISPIRVFEMGFGSGLNAALTREEADRHRVSVDYTTVERYPLEESVIGDMKMPNLSQDERERWLDLHRTPWEQVNRVSPFFTFQKYQTSFPEIARDIAGPFHLLYYDAFAPAAQPELWSIHAMDTCYQLLASGGLWLSYCAKGQVRRNLREVGFEVEAIPGPPGKREITLAVKS